MNTYYSTLGVTPEATEKEIKRAYFALVKKYSPERDAEKFQEIRAAYEVLSDKNARAQYDNIANLPEGSAALFAQAEAAMRGGFYPDAIDLYAELSEEWPDTSLFRAELANAYYENGNTGKSSKLWAELCEAEPQNAAYAGELAYSYDARGWRNKAIAQYKHAISLDEDNVSLWEALLHCYFEGNQAAEIMETLDIMLPLSRERGFENDNLYFFAITCCLRFEIYDPILEYIRRAKELAEHSEFWVGIFSVLLKAQKYTLLDEALKIVGPLSLPEEEAEVYRKIRLMTEIYLAEEYPDALKDLLVPTLLGFSDPESRLDILMAKRFLLENDGAQYMASLRDTHPELYALAPEFFGALQNARGHEQLYTKTYREYQRLIKSHPELLDDMEDAPDETFVREEPKVGRNDPCPCGSGKKYKKCCAQE